MAGGRRIDPGLDRESEIDQLAELRSLNDDIEGIAQAPAIGPDGRRRRTDEDGVGIDGDDLRIGFGSDEMRFIADYQCLAPCGGQAVLESAPARRFVASAVCPSWA